MADTISPTLAAFRPTTRGFPHPQPDSFTECHPWKEQACCSQGTVESADKLRKSYGPEYHWDRCGPLSPECERFFVQVRRPTEARGRARSSARLLWPLVLR